MIITHYDCLGEVWYYSLSDGLRKEISSNFDLAQAGQIFGFTGAEDEEAMYHVMNRITSFWYSGHVWRCKQSRRDKDGFATLIAIPELVAQIITSVLHSLE